MSYLNPRDLLEEAKDRKGRDAERLGMYGRCRAAYFGEGRERGSAVRSMDGNARPMLQLLTQTRSYLQDRGGAPNMLMPIVDDYTHLLGDVPTMKVLPEDDSPEAKDRAALRSRVLRSTWLQSNMEGQCQMSAFQLSCLGDSIMTLSPLPPTMTTDDPFLQPGVYITVVDPSTAFPQFKSGLQRDELADLMILDQMPARRAEVSFPTWSRDCGPDEKVDVVYYLGPTGNCTDVRGTRVEEIEHNLGFCPAEWIGNKMVGRTAQSDIAHVLDLHNEMQIMFLVMADSLVEATYSQLVIRDPVNVQEQFEVGPGARPIVVQATGGVDRIRPGDPPRAAEMIMHTTWDQLSRMTGSAPVRVEGQISGSNISGKSVHAQQGPMESRLAGRQNILGLHYQKINSKILRMLSDIPEFQGQEMTMWGTEKGKPYAVSFTADDIGGWTKNVVTWSAMIGASTHERATVGLQLLGNGLVTGEWVLEQVGVDDPEAMMKEAQAEQAEKMKQQQAMQGGQPPGGGMPPDQQAQALDKGATPGGESGAAQPPPGGGAPPPGAEGGAPPGGQPPQMPGFAPMDSSPTDQAVGTPSPVPDVQGQIREVLRQVGPSLMGGIAGVYPVPGGIHVDLTAKPGSAADANDRRVLRKAFKDSGMGKVEFGKAN